MNHTLFEEIKKMLKEISPWPWRAAEGVSGDIIFSPKVDNDDMNLICEIPEDKVAEASQRNLLFILHAPEIITDLVEEVENLNQDLNNTLRFHYEENKRLREALEFYAVASDLEDDPGNLARRVLKK